MSITVFLADDHGIVREGLRLLLNAQPDIHVVGEAANGREAVRQIVRLRPQIAILDLAMPELNGIETTRQLQDAAPDTQVIILSMYASSEHIYQALKAGARGYVLKEAAAEELVNAVVAVQAGQRFLNAKVADELIADYLGNHASLAQESPLTQLSDREREVLQLVVEGKTSSEISELIALSPKTVDTYRSRLMQKLGIKDLPALVKFAIQHGITALE
ncbi:MAG: DNA-binding response regulator [Caldilinea sp. CFX5]|nr:DNA-binding response regulator [Caldilinea sp. CFX5]